LQAADSYDQRGPEVLTMMTREPRRGPKPCFGLPSENELDEIHLATLEILERVGLQIQSSEARALFEEAGASLKSDVVKVPPWLVKESLSSAPPAVYLPGRAGHRDLMLGPGRPSFSCVLEAQDLLNLDTGAAEPPDSEALALATKAMDSLEVISIALRPAVTGGEGLRSVADYETMVNATAKHVVLSPENGKSLEIILDMAKAAAGHRRAEGPGLAVSFVSKAESPLMLPESACEVILEGARRGAAVCVMSRLVSGASASPNPGAAMAIHNAEILGGIILAQLAKKGAKVIYGSSPSVMRPKEAKASAGSPEPASMGAAAASLARRYQIPSLIAGARGDSKLPDAQAGHEKTLTAIMPALAGARVIHGLGGLEGGAALSLEQLLMDADFAAMILLALEGLSLSGRCLSLDLADHEAHRHLSPKHQIGPGRGGESSCKLIDRRARASWLNDGGGLDIYQRARACLKEIAAHRRGEPLAEGAKEAVRKIARDGL
jgi:trimethylamine--corrinoid protein Co-methyltransferase